MSFPEKAFLFNSVAGMLYPMSYLKEQSLLLKPEDPSKYKFAYLACGVKEAYMATGVEVRLPAGWFIHDFPGATFTLTIDGEKILDRVWVDTYIGENDCVLPSHIRSDLFRAYPFSEHPKEPMNSLGLFLPNGTMVRGALEGIPEGLDVEIILKTALYKVTGGTISAPLGPREWSPTNKPCL